ncbi:aminotransferase class I/II-fold pyridoxal phosphate-dependent enzyme [Bacillus sp. FSL W7-1360]
MDTLHTMNKTGLQEHYHMLKGQFDHFCAQNISLNMARGKPSPAQLDLSMDLLNVLTPKDCLQVENGIDPRNYGGLDGIPEAKGLFAKMFGVRSSQVFVGGNSSLTLMHDRVARAMTHGVEDGCLPWSKLPKVKFLCPVPSYDRHFEICALFGIEMIPIAMTEEGPDIDEIERLVREDDAIKGMWCVPKYSNPTGITYSDEVVRRLARMQTKARDFRLFWDNAYAVHHLTNTPDELRNIFEDVAGTENENRVYMFASTSKMTFPGAGISAFISSEANITAAKKRFFSVQTIGADKINQLRHVRFFEKVGGIPALMKKHAEILKPKFAEVDRAFTASLSGKGIATWTKPKGGYFVSLNVLDGCAKRVVALAKQAGVTLTTAGATFPYGVDPRDRNIRIAPTYPSMSELEQAMKIICVCVELAAVEKLLAV